ncbi:MAG: hypothetical protein EXS05_12415 [Planctomycetaceae bacterium]|nr:hypothetical protein [Planctomycetaceae bacterium]
MTRFELRLIAIAGFASLVLVVGATEEAHAQAYARRNWGAYGSPATPLSAQIIATADLVRGIGEKNRSDAEARAINARTTAQTIENIREWDTLKRDIRKLNREERRELQKYNSFIERMKRGNKLLLEQMRDLPELSQSTVHDGKRLNFLLNRMANNVLAPPVSLHPEPSPFEQLEALSLSRETLHGLKLIQVLQGSKGIAFHADEAVTLKKDVWPVALQGANFASLRNSYDSAFNAVIEGKRTKKDGGREIERLKQSYNELQQQFSKLDTRDARLKGNKTNKYIYQDLTEAGEYLKRLNGAIRRLEETGARLPEDQLAFKGKNLFGLLSHMVRNGLKFAPAEKGDEPAYKQVFDMMLVMCPATNSDEKSAGKSE